VPEIVIKVKKVYVYMPVDAKYLKLNINFS